MPPTPYLSLPTSRGVLPRAQLDKYVLPALRTLVEGELEASIARLRQAAPDRDPRTETQSKEDE